MPHAYATIDMQLRGAIEPQNTRTAELKPSQFELSHEVARGQCY
jgi:hypothetical protein